MILAELCTQLGLPKGTVHRLCSNLVASGHLVREADERMFSIGPAFRKMAFDALNHSSPHGMRHAVLKNLVSEIRETCNFTTLDGTEVLYLDRVEARWPLRLTIDIGSHVPIHCTSSGKLLLAHLPKRQRDALISRLDLTPMTSATITDPQVLRKQCDAIVEQGFACDNEEFAAGLISVAVPVRDMSGTVCATISVHAPTIRLTLERAREQIHLLHDAAAAMQRVL